MISFLKGTVWGKNKNSITIMTASGVGYEVKLSVPLLATLKREQEVALPIYLKMSENSMELYGFANEEEKEFFGLLITVSGIGPKTAMSVLSLGSGEEIKKAIARGDVEYLTSVQGLGKKTAERIAVELKGKMQMTEIESRADYTSADAEAIEGLVSMGYSRDEAARAVNSVKDREKLSSSAVLRAALRKIAAK